MNSLKMLTRSISVRFQRTRIMGSRGRVDGRQAGGRAGGLRRVRELRIFNPPGS